MYFFIWNTFTGVTSLIFQRDIWSTASWNMQHIQKWLLSMWQILLLSFNVSEIEHGQYAIIEFMYWKSILIGFLF